MGPARPYLASQVGVGNQAISLLWTAKSAGVCLACFISGPAFLSKFMEPSQRRLLFLGTIQILTSMCLLAVPFMENYILLLSLYGLLTFASGSFDLTDNGLMNTMLGPEISRPFVQSLHALAAVGFVVVTPIVPYFLPPESAESSKELCAQLKSPIEDESISDIGGDFNANTTSSINEDSINDNGWPILFPAFSIVGIWILINGISLIVLGIKEMTATTAGWLNTVYYATYTIGRLASIPLSTMVSPSKIIIASSFGCLIATIILIFFGINNSLAFFLSVGLLGFSICFMFGSGISWITSNIPSSMKNRPMSFIFMGANLATGVGPILASKMFDLNPIYVFYSCIVYVILVIICFLSMILVARKGNQKSNDSLEKLKI